MAGDRTVVATAGLVEALLDLAEDADPKGVTAALATTESQTFDGTADLDEGTPVFTHFYFPDTGRSNAAVFGVDLSVPPRGAQGRFVSHPRGELGVTERDPIHEVTLVAVPPWDGNAIGAFDRRGTRLDLLIVDIAPPEESIPW